MPGLFEINLQRKSMQVSFSINAKQADWYLFVSLKDVRVDITGTIRHLDAVSN
jgi:hypothetical protein